jgi:hypothetical protein
MKKWVETHRVCLDAIAILVKNKPITFGGTTIGYNNHNLILTSG